MARGAADAGIALCVLSRAGWGGAPGGQAVCCRISRRPRRGSASTFEKTFPRAPCPAGAVCREKRSAPSRLHFCPGRPCRAPHGLSRSVRPARLWVRRSSAHRRSRPSAFVPLCRRRQVRFVRALPPQLFAAHCLRPGRGSCFQKKGSWGSTPPASLFRVLSNPFDQQGGPRPALL